ncbi:hypothetical protein Poli38472_011670 [Pythium oligandrum]|uniref:Uncharacterized protein n=1 Tax=Pythium oligandrum TaxID=41045 RepID=A0A8K1CLD8_PYTOL|nr:hypothetical protein Poli38472_013779 [Pythium oligandrum]TMW64790.1 hypothetical protein Poli38472_011670 [Pythium oligandrum]|eukprot:TMW55017.1 hypothetical protein Poli38472_013779 [Pythium oligandrum]
MLRVLLRLPATRARPASTSTAAFSSSSDKSLADKFRLAALNDGKNPFEVSSNRLMKVTFNRRSHKLATPSAGATEKTTKPNTVKTLRKQYSLDYLSNAPKKGRRRSNPFDVPSSKLM